VQTRMKEITSAERGGSEQKKVEKSYLRSKNIARAREVTGRNMVRPWSLRSTESGGGGKRVAVS